MHQASRASSRVDSRLRVAVLAAALVTAGLAVRADGAGPRPDWKPPSRASAVPQVGAVVRTHSPRSRAAERLVRRLGGQVTRRLPIIDGFAARVPRAALPKLRRSGAIVSVWLDAPVTMADADDDDDDEDDDLDDLSTYDALKPSSAWRDAVGLSAVRGLTGSSVGVAVIDTGVTPAADLSESVEARVELTPGHDGIDRFGHGTHIAGLIAGNGAASEGRWRGVARRADLISIKVAGPDGATDVSVVLAALQWVVANKQRYDIRVLNLSFGTDSTSSYLTDPLDYAVERAWRAGIFVVTAAGNGGPGAGSVLKPADDPFVVTVGAADIRGTADRSDDVVAEFSSRGPTVDGVAKPDLVAPGISVVSVRAPGSLADLNRPEARVGSAYFKGTGTSQAAAIVSGIAALMFEAKPSLTPDEAKAALVGTSSGLVGQLGAGSGLVHAARAVDAVRAGRYVAAVNSLRPPATGTGELEASRGSHRVYGDPDGDGVPQLITGEVDVLGNPWVTGALPTAPWSLEDWSASAWRDVIGVFDGLKTHAWTGPTWSGIVAEAGSWSAKYWSDSAWAAKYWSGKYWSASNWN